MIWFRKGRNFHLQWVLATQAEEAQKLRVTHQVFIVKDADTFLSDPTKLAECRAIYDGAKR